MKAKELITKVLVGNPKTIVSIFAVMLLICGIQGIGYAQAPEFADDGVVPRSISENLPNTNVGVVLNVTPGEIPLNDLHYNFGDPGNLDFASFRLIAVAGGVQLQTRAALDYEKQTDYEVIITVRDNIANNGGRAREADDEITVIITVTNVTVANGDIEVANSEPEFDEGTSTTRSVPENTPKGMNINTSGIPTAEDPVEARKALDAADANAATTFTYGLLRGADTASFDIDSMTGQLKTKVALNYETKASYMVTVTVSDGKDAADNVDPAVDDRIRVTIMVTDENEAPVFPDTIAPIVVAENTVTDTNIGAPVVAMDEDKGDTDTLTYTLGGTDAEEFEIVATSGQLQTKVALDYETQTDYEVMVIATDTDNLMGEITVTINVRNVSVGDDPVENREPVFNDGPSTTRSVAEKTAAKANIGAPVAARDVDTGDTLTYTLSGANDNNDDASFDIDTGSGQLKTKVALDHETGDEYIVTVSVKDGKEADGTGTVTPTEVDDTIRVTIMVTDVNEPPVFPATIDPIEVAENTAAGANIGAVVVATDVDSGDTADTLTYTLGGTDADSFAIESTADGGQLQTKAPLDYETQTDYEVTVIATDTGSLMGEITVTITVGNVTVANGDTEVANSEPEFDEGTSTTRSVPENTPKGMNINTSGIPTEADPVEARKAPEADDASAGATFTYGLLSGADAASFDIDTGSGQLKTKAALDHEDKASYMVTVTVTDGKDALDNFDPTVDDTIMVTITVTNVNEAPVFPDTIAPIEVAEDTVAGVNIGAVVVATDVDKGDTDTLTYTLGGTDAEEFEIVATSGQLQTKVALDYETQTDYEVMVIATDTDNLMGEITVTINVRNVSVGDDPVENREPVFNDGPSTTRSVAEKTAAKANIGAPVAARDVDTGDTLTYTLSGANDNNDDASFDIDTGSGQLKTKVALDHETGDEYIVTVSVKDGKEADGTGTVTPTEVDDTIRVTIMVTDVNEPPVFPATIDPIEVAENTAAGANIGAVVVATDVDSGDTADTLTYTLGGTDADSFAIESTADGGQLQTKAPLDYETKTDYEVTVIATDTGSLMGEITVTITVGNVTVANGDTEVANSEPEFDDGPSTTRSVPENTPKGMNINTSGIPTEADPVEARKAPEADDASAGATFTYGLLSGADAASFDIDTGSGQLKTKAALDHEDKASYMVTVTVTDGKDALDNFDPTVDDTIMVTITVTNVNEAPVFPDTIAPIEVAEDTVAGVNIGAVVVATDVDKGDTDTLTYTLGGTDAEEFEIVATSGQLQTKVALDYETQTDYEVMVIATDTGNLMGEITVTINVRNVSVGDTEVTNSEPAFNDGPSTTRSVAEKTAAKANIGAPVAARDVDTGDTLTYTLGDTHRAFFAIDSMTGQLKTADPLANPLDHETGDEYIVTVSVKDGKEADGTVAPTEVDDTIRVTIMVTDVNEPPVFPATIDPIEVAENTAAGANIGAVVVATDVDSGDTADTLTYTLGGTDADSFAIESTADGGQLQTKAPLDYETKTDYEVTVIATDTGSLMGEITVTITVGNVTVANGDTEVANSEPEFDDGPSTTRSVPENTPKGMNINTSGIPTEVDPVEARKAPEADDASAGATFTYGLLSGADAASFDI